MLKAGDRQKFLKTMAEQIFIQEIYSAVIRGLIAQGGFVLRTDEIRYLAGTFAKENLGSQEEAVVCLAPAWVHTTHKGEKCAKQESEGKFRWRGSLPAAM